MSFNLNRLVQPECGAPNPLVAAAQQITMRPSVSTVAATTSLSRTNHHQAPDTFAREFLETQKAHTGQQAVAAATVGLHSMVIGSSTSGNLMLRQHQQHMAQDLMAARGAFMQPAAQTTTMGFMGMGIMGNATQRQQHDLMVSTSGMQSAAEQLETKYRNDMISQSYQQQQNSSSKGKLDDVKFWQALSQGYIGQTTYGNIARMTAEARSELKIEATTETEGTTNMANDQMESTASKFDDGLEEVMHWPDDKIEIVSSNRLARVPSEMEYTFDERNPLKDQFENPFEEGLKKLEQGDIPSAALLFEAAVQLEPNNTEAWRYLGTTQAQNEKDMSAIRALRNCLKLDQADQQARLAISVSLANEMYHHEACKCLIEWLINHEKYKTVGASLEEFHQLDNELTDSPFHVNAVDQKHYRYVRDKFVDAARLSPTYPDPEVQSSLGVLFNMRGEYEKAVDCFKAALSVKSDDSLLWNRLGATLANGNKSDEAVIAYRKALEISPGFLRSRYNLAISLIHLNCYDEAARQLVQILNMQAAGKGGKNTQIRTRSITSTAIWNTLRTVATLLNKPEFYPIIDGRDLARCNEEIFKTANTSTASGQSSADI